MPNIPRLIAERRLAERQRRREQRQVAARPTLRFAPEPIDWIPSPSELDAPSKVQVVRTRPTLQGMPPLDQALLDDEPTNRSSREERTREDVPSMFRAPPSPRDHEVTAQHDMSRLREASRESDLALLWMLVAG
jgi:hypothetical protein